MTETLSPQDSDPFWQGLDQFNRGEFYACHDTLEAIWMVAPIPEKPFFQGILQLAVALYHLSNHNWQGAAILLGEGIRRLEPFEPTYREIDVSDLLDRASLWLDTLQQLGPTQVSRLAAALIPVDQHPSEMEAPPPLPTWEIHRISSMHPGDSLS